MPERRVLFAASEIYPFAKTGGLADVGHGLPKALAESNDVTVVMPLYRTIDRDAYGIGDAVGRFEVTLGERRYPVAVHECRHGGLRHLFVHAPLLCDRAYLYGPPGEAYDDNALRFGLFSHALVQIAKAEQSDIVHLNDWQTALAALLIAEDASIAAKTVYTIHNLSFQGVFARENLALLGIGRSRFTMEGVEFYGSINLMKAGIGFADAVTTVSPTYAAEILTPRYGCGLEGYLQRHRAKLTGIVNGIDTVHFSPSADRALAHPYKTPRGKAKNKQAYLDEVGLKGAEKPLFIFIGRFAWQKGMDMLIEALPTMAERDCNIAIVGEGEKRYREGIGRAAAGRANVHLFFGYDEMLAHRMYAAADFLLMPSLFEPCGLNQLIAAHYGAVPVVHRVGGLADTVRPLTACPDAPAAGCGIVFDDAETETLLAAFESALSLYADAPRCRRIASHNMKVDVSWKRSASAYAAVYRKISKGTVE